METSLPGRAETRLQARVLTRLRDAGPQSRIELAEHFDVSRTAIAAEVGRLTELRLVEEVGPAASRGGRRSTIIDLASGVRFVGIAIGATSVSTAITDGRLQVLAFERIACDVRQGPEPVLRFATERSRKLLLRLGWTSQWGLVWACLGRSTSVVASRCHHRSCPGGTVTRFDFFAQEFCCPVVMDNDVNVMALGEQHAGVASTADNFLFVKIGSGIGCGMVVKGMLYRGIDGCAGDIGHIAVADSNAICACGNTGCLEASFGGTALSRDALAAARSGRSPLLMELLERKKSLTAAELGQAVNAGDVTSVQLVREGGRRVGEVLASLVSFFNPSLIVLGGGVMALAHLLLPEIRGVIHHRSRPSANTNLPIVASEVGQQAGVIGAARLVSDEIYHFFA